MRLSYGLIDEFDVRKMDNASVFFVSLQRARSPEIDTDAQTDKTKVAEFSFSPANYAENS